MAKRIENPADCEIRAVIRFLEAKNIQPADIHRQVCEVYGEEAMSGSMVRRWCWQFESGPDNVHDDKRSGRPSVVTPDLERIHHGSGRIFPRMCHGKLCTGL